MRYVELEQDLFTLSSDYMLVHCISSDYALGAGIARTFRDRYDLANKLKELGKRKWDDTGFCVIVNMDDNARLVSADKATHRVANLVTKENYWNKPTMGTIRDALIDLRVQIEDGDVRKIAMPKIASGLDRQNWEQVRLTIIQVFKDMRIDIVVCTKKGVSNRWL